MTKIRGSYILILDHTKVGRNNFRMFVGETKFPIVEASHPNEAVEILISTPGTCQLLVTEFIYQDAISLAPLVERTKINFIELINDDGFVSARLLIRAIHRGRLFVKNLALVAPYSKHQLDIDFDKHKFVHYLQIPCSNEETKDFFGRFKV